MQTTSYSGGVCQLIGGAEVIYIASWVHLEVIKNIMYVYKVAFSKITTGQIGNKSSAALDTKVHYLASCAMFRDSKATYVCTLRLTNFSNPRVYQKLILTKDDSIHQVPEYDTNIQLWFAQVYSNKVRGWA